MFFRKGVWYSFCLSEFNRVQFLYQLRRVQIKQNPNKANQTLAFGERRNKLYPHTVSRPKSNPGYTGSKRVHQPVFQT